MKKNRKWAGYASLTLMPMLSGCLFVTDTSLMNADVFVRETAPIFQYQEGGTIPPTLLPQTPGSIIRSPPDLYRTRFQQQYAPIQGQSVAYGLPVSDPLHRSYYGQITDDARTIPAVPYQRVDSKYLRQEVNYQSKEKPGTIIVDTKQNYLFLVQDNGKAIRYGVGLGKDGYAWSGRGKIQWKAKWPRWTPPDEMVKRQPELASVSGANGGMGPGLNNPLGARALYIFKDGQDTLYRVHGTPDWKSVGRSTSSGCVRMFNQDVIDLYERVPQGAEIVVI